MQRLYKLVMYSCAVVTSLSIPVDAHAETATGPKGDANAVRAAAKEYLAAVRRGDANTLRKMWTPDGDYVDASGQLLEADELIQQLAASATPGAEPAETAVADSTLRFVTPTVAIENGISNEVTAADGSILAGRFTAVWVFRSGKWMLHSLREVATASPAGNEPLVPLEWLLGEWTGASEDGVILVSSHWSDGGNYIVREFVMRGKDGEKIGGTQRIGWDPVASQIKSWSFDSQGGSGDDVWRHDGKRWIVESSDVRADGQQSKTSVVYTPGDDGRFVWEVESAILGGMKLRPARVEFQRAVEDE